jgi:hypothetical protein
MSESVQIIGYTTAMVEDIPGEQNFKLKRPQGVVALKLITAMGLIFRINNDFNYCGFFSAEFRSPGNMVEIGDKYRIGDDYRIGDNICWCISLAI